MIVLSIDPGSKKCGLAVVCSERGTQHREIVPTEALAGHVDELVARFSPEVVLLGDGTKSSTVESALGASGTTVVRVKEGHTTERARKRYWRENPPRGLLRLYPTGLRTPLSPVDDWAAVILAEDWLASRDKLQV